MGRLDNAMRRAAEDRARASAGTIDVEDRSAGEFPSEEPAHVNGTAPASIEVDFPNLDAPAAPPELSGQAEEAAPAEPAAPSALRPADERKSLLQHIDATLQTKTVVDDSMLPTSREQYRRLAAALHQAQRASGVKVMMVASAVAGEGKTLTAANLGLTLSESYRRSVLVIDGDLRRPTLHTVFGVSGAPGLSDGLVSAGDPKLPLHRLSPRLTLLPAGRATSDPMGALTSERMRRLVDEAREVFDWVIIDTPPIGLLTDASLLSSMADGVVLVVKAESTSFDMVNRAVDTIGRDRLMGVVLNRAKELAHRTNYDYYKYYSGGSKVPATRG